jgi:AcrR family transcriptional regulator
VQFVQKRYDPFPISANAAEVPNIPRSDDRSTSEERLTGPGRPRSARAHRAILASAAALLRERGLRDTSIEAIAQQAGVSKKTIYRWWPSKGTLALDAFHREWVAAQDAVPDTGSLEGDLRVRMRAAVRVLGRPQLGSTVAALIAEAQSDRELAEVYERDVLEPQRAQVRAILARAAARGEIPADADAEVAIDLLQGALYLRLLHTHAPLDRAFADATVDVVTRGLRPRS